MAHACPGLPDECWELIIDRLDRACYLESVSLVSKQLFSVTNRLHRSFKMIGVASPLLPRLLLRFPNLTAIDLSEFHGDLDRVVSTIARSASNIEDLDLSNHNTLPLKGLSEMGPPSKRKKGRRSGILKALRVSLCSLTAVDVVSIVDSLPMLEEIDISYPKYDVQSGDRDSLAFVNDSTIEKLSSKLKNLRKIDVSGNHLLSDCSLWALSLNCVFLRDIAVRDCCFVTQNGIGFVLRHCTNLVSLSVTVNGFGLRSPPPLVTASDGDGVSSVPTIENSITFARSICVFHLTHMIISDQQSVSDSLLRNIAESRLPLKSLALCYCQNFTLTGISLLLRSYPSLVSLDLKGTRFLTDECVLDLSQFLHKLTSINLCSCSKLTDSTIFTLGRSCPSLVQLDMGLTSLGKEDICVEFVENSQIRNLNVAFNDHLNNKSLRKYGLMCPNLQSLDVTYCRKITTEGIEDILNTCPVIKNLDVSRCMMITSVGSDLGGSELSLEVLRARESLFNDQGLAMVGKRCCRLLQLDLGFCTAVTGEGVKEVLRSCKNLREINLKNCRGVSKDILAWMVFSRPSLRKIVPPQYCSSTQRERELFSGHGCQILSC